MRLGHYGASTLLVVSLLGCSAIQQSPVPGTTNRVFQRKAVPFSVVKAALKAQLASAFVEIDALRRKHRNHPLKESFILKKGSAKLTGQTKTVVTDEGKLALVVPFTGYDGSTLSPSLGGTRSSEAVQEIALSFEVEPTASNINVRDHEKLDGVDVGDFLEKALVAAYLDALEMPHDGANPYEPKFTNTEIVIKASFVVKRVYDAGLTSTVIVPAHDLNSVSPTLGVKHDRSHTYTLEVKLPMLFEQPPSESRRLLYLVAGANGIPFFVEEPYTEKRYKELRGNGAPGVRVLGVADPQPPRQPARPSSN